MWSQSYQISRSHSNFFRFLSKHLPFPVQLKVDEIGTNSLRARMDDIASILVDFLVQLHNIYFWHLSNPCLEKGCETTKSGPSMASAVHNVTSTVFRHSTFRKSFSGSG